MKDFVFWTGSVMLAAGIGLFSVPAALIVVGIFLIGLTVVESLPGES